EKPARTPKSRYINNRTQVHTFLHHLFSMDIFGLALQDFFQHKSPNTLWIHNKYGEKEEMPVDVFFRTEAEMPELEKLALNLCKGKVLDIGAGVGSHALVLQQDGIDVTALELSANACQIMKEKGVRKVLNEDIFTYKSEKFDTLLLLMNGIGLSKTLLGVVDFLKVASDLLAPNGQLIFDSSDISYLYEDSKMPEDRYYGEISYQYEYKSQKSTWFKWLYIDQNLITQIANEQGWNCTILYEDEFDQYLAKLTKKN
ncbi:MAG: SAM-dependent methyltransferase, partial [Daejeonella sp.]|nr:SAM-dependent methyltransferase [Daejeonella sp.]